MAKPMDLQHNNIRAERRVGELIREQKTTVGLNEGGRPQKTPPRERGVLDPTLHDAVSARAQKTTVGLNSGTRLKGGGIGAGAPVDGAPALPTLAPH